jgi:transposase
MSSFLSVRALHEEGVAKKTIARRLGIDPRTVRKYIRRIERGDREPRRAAVPRKLDSFRDRVRALTEQGLSAVQIWQELGREPSFSASYETVKRLVRQLRPVEIKVYSRLTFRPGEEAQIDFGDVGRMLVGDRMQRAHLFVMTLCFSRLAYYQLTVNQTVPTFLRAIRRGFESFGGAPRRLKPDNLRSAVLLNQLGERYYQEDFFRFCRHYGTVPDAARPATPTDKGRVERDIGYAKGNWLRGRHFEDIVAAQASLTRWRREIADVRVHGTTRRRPVDLFDEQERAHLHALPEDPFEISTWGRYRVRKDIHVHVEGNYYSVPWRLAGQWVTLRLRDDEVAVFAHGEQVASHVRLDGRGQTATDPAHVPPSKRLATQEIHRRRVMTVREAGPHCAEYLSRLRDARWIQGDQIARLARLVATYGQAAVEGACRRALFFGATDGAARLERILSRGLHERPLPTADGPALEGGRCDYGRSLADYQALLGQGEVN